MQKMRHELLAGARTEGKREALLMASQIGGTLVEKRRLLIVGRRAMLPT